MIAIAAAGAWAGPRRGVIDAPNAAGVLRTVTLDGGPLDETNPFFKSLGTNGRSCVSCHAPESGWTISPAEVQARFNKTDGLDPIFRTVDGANSPRANVQTLGARRVAYSMLLSRGVIRVGAPMPANAEFELVAVDDPYQFASARELSLFRRPLPSTNLRFLTGVMWDGRESYAPTGTTPIKSNATPGDNATALFDDLLQQAEDATIGHAQGGPIAESLLNDIVAFELNLATAQQESREAGVLNARGPRGGPAALVDEPFYVTINDVLGADGFTGRFEPHAMPLFDAWAAADNPRRAAIARGAALFGSPRIEITGVGGLNDDLDMPTIRGACTTCHDTPNVGNHSVALPIDIGLTDAPFRTPDLPLYTLRNLATGQSRQTTDPGRALLTGRWNDIGKFKGPVLRGLAARAPYFHNGSAADLGAVLDFYEKRFATDFTPQEKADLIAFLNSL
jgi:cytochrome c peroxidase